jgi:hypothetical protein
MCILGQTYHKGLQPNSEQVRGTALLTDLAAWLDHTGVKRDEDPARRATIWTALADADATHETAVVSPGSDSTPLRVLRPRNIAPVTRSIAVDTDDLHQAPWTEHELVVLLRRVLERTPAEPGALLRRDTNLYCFIHTNLRAILIADVDGVGLGTLWSTREAKAVLRLVIQHPNVFTRTVVHILIMVILVIFASKSFYPIDRTR